jgi:hypothetical protein
LLLSKCSRGMLTDPLRATRDDHYFILKHNRTSFWIGFANKVLDKRFFCQSYLLCLKGAIDFFGGHR